MTVHPDYSEGTAAAVDALAAVANAHRANGDMVRFNETETWLALAREDHAAAVAGLDANQLAAMGPESIMTGPAPCCEYPDDLTPQEERSLDQWEAQEHLNDTLAAEQADREAGA